jgi:hypothetical protein
MSNIQFPNTLLGPGAFSAAVKDNNGDPATVLEAGLDFTVETEWEIDDAAHRQPELPGRHHRCGE